MPKSYPEKARDRIKAGKILTRLQKCALGLVEMTPAEISAAKVVLGKVLPDLKATEITGTLTTKKADELSEQDLLSIAAGGSAGDIAPSSSADEPDSVH